MSALLFQGNHSRNNLPDSAPELTLFQMFYAFSIIENKIKDLLVHGIPLEELEHRETWVRLQYALNHFLEICLLLVIIGIQKLQSKQGVSLWKFQQRKNSNELVFLSGNYLVVFCKELLFENTRVLIPHYKIKNVDNLPWEITLSNYDYLLYRTKTTGPRSGPEMQVP